jgi:hypothetical protein
VVLYINPFRPGEIVEYYFSGNTAVYTAFNNDRAIGFNEEIL